MIRRRPIISKAWLRRDALTLLAVVLSQLIASAALDAQDKNDGKLARRAERAGEVLAELVSVPDKAPPKALLSAATCVAVLPEVVQAGLGIGGRIGRGLASCRTPEGWSLPTFVDLKGGSVGFQFGVEASDVVMVFVNRDADRLASNFNVGGDASVAAGPIGRNVSAETDVRLRSEIYSYSKSKGLFAGVSLSGTSWRIDRDANRGVYASAPTLPQGGDSESVKALLKTGGADAPAIVRPFLQSLEKNVGPGKKQ